VISPKNRDRFKVKDFEYTLKLGPFTAHVAYVALI